MGKPAIPPYGKDFVLVHLPYLPYKEEFAPRRYELKADRDWFIQSTRNSKKWRVFIKAPGSAQDSLDCGAFPVGKPGTHNTMREAMAKALALYETVQTAISGDRKDK